MSLKQTAINGMFWTFIQQMSSQGIAFVVSIILARILLPEEFGLIALLGVFIIIADNLINSGLGDSLIRTENPNNDDYSTVFYFNLLISIALYALMFFIAPVISNFYKQPLLISITRVYCLVFIFNAFSIIQNTLLSKNLDFKKMTIINIPSTLVGAAVGVVMAYNGFGVWSLVWSNLTRAAARSIQLWIWSPWIPTLSFKKEKIKKHLNFGYKLTLSSVIDSIFRDIYTIIIGKFFNPLQVGFYNRANTLQMYPISNFSAILNTVTYPLFSKIQHDNKQLKNAYKKIMQMSVFLIAPTLLTMSALAEPLFRFLLTEKWLPAVPYFQILCFTGIFYPINAYNLNIISVKGRSDLLLLLSIVKKILIVFTIFISFQWGIYGLLFGQIPFAIIAIFFNGYYSGKLINYGILEQFKHITPSIVYSLICGLIVYFLDTHITKVYTDIFRLLLGGGVSIFCYFILSYFLNKSILLDLISIVSPKK
jgi:O-antigen/teichoic acid export membrane protein